MSRMDRYKHIHEEAEKASKPSVFQRKTRKSEPKETRQEENESIYDEIKEEEPQRKQPFLSKPSKKEKRFGRKKSADYGYKTPKKKRKKHRVLRFILKLIVLLLLYSGISFVVGQFVARTSSDRPAQETAFNGMTSQSGANNILLIGSDSRDGESARADTIMVLQLDGPSRKPKLISFMRDTLVNIPGFGENKINAAYAFGGAELLRTTLSQNFGIDTKYYMTVDFQTFEKVIDTLFPGGVYINAEKDMSQYIEVAIQQGPQNMDGLTLLQYARFRMDEEGDFGRVRRQQQVMDAIFSELRNPLAILKLPYAAGKVMGSTSTNLGTGFLLGNTFSIARGASGIDRLSIPVDDSWSFGQSFELGSFLLVDYEMNRQAIFDFLQK